MRLILTTGVLPTVPRMLANLVIGVCGWRRLLRRSSLERSCVPEKEL
jgi:hypothetical protein